MLGFEYATKLLQWADKPVLIGHVYPEAMLAGLNTEQ